MDFFKKIFLLVIFLVLSNCFLKCKPSNHGANQAISQTVILNIFPEYDEYFDKEDIWLDFKLKNYSKENYYLKDPFEITGIVIEISRPSNTKLRLGPIGDFIPNDSNFIEPSKTAEHLIPLNMIYSYTERENKIEYGSYKMNVMYQDITSNEVFFEISEPKGEDKEFLNATDKLFSGNISENEKMIKLERLLETFPSTRYTPQFYDILLLNFYTSDQYGRIQRDVENFLQYNSNTYGATFILRTYSDYLSNYLKLDSNQFYKNLYEIAAKYPGSKTEKIINLNWKK